MKEALGDLSEEGKMAKSKVETIDTGISSTPKSYEEEIGVDTHHWHEFENKKAVDPNFVYRWCLIDNTAYFKTKSYIAITKDEADRIKPFSGEWEDGAWHAKPNNKDHYILMRCPKALFDKRRDYYGSVGKDQIKGDKERLKEVGRQNWRRGDSIGPEDIIVDERLK